MRISDWSSDVCSSDLKRLRPRDHRSTALGVVTTGLRRRRVERVGAVERVVEAAPARIGGVERETRVEGGHDQLRPRHRRDLGVDIAGADAEWRGFGDEIADFAQERLIGRGVVPLPFVLLVPRVDRSDEPRLGKECVRTGRYRGSPSYKKKK